MVSKVPPQSFKNLQELDEQIQHLLNVAYHWIKELKSAQLNIYLVSGFKIKNRPMKSYLKFLSQQLGISFHALNQSFYQSNLTLYQ